MKGLAIAIILILVILSIVYALYNQSNIFGSPSMAASDNLLNMRFGVSKITEHYNNTTTSTYSVYLALTPQQQQEGYMNVSTIGNCNNTGSCLGMLFVFSNYSDECFWMKNTAIPLRQTWINQSGYPVYSYVGKPLSTEPICSYGQYVIETLPNTTISGYITTNLS